jgi:hypothetical protein
MVIQFIERNLMSTFLESYLPRTLYSKFIDGLIVNKKCRNCFLLIGGIVQKEWSLR